MQLTRTPFGRRYSATLLLLLAPALALAAQDASRSDPPGVVALIGSATIVESDLDEWLREQDASTYHRLRRDIYDGRRRALEALMAERLLSLEASRRGVTQEELLEREVSRLAKPVTDADVTSFLSGNPLPAGTPASVLTPVVTALLRQRAMEAARAEFLAQLRDAPEAGVVVFLEPPRVSGLRAPHNPTRGRPDATVEIVVFSDFECPFCQRTEPVLSRLLTRFPAEVLLVWKHYPLSIHRNARPAAEAAQCAHDQNRFWEFHDAIVADPPRLQAHGLTATASDIGLDMAAFAQCVKGRVHDGDVLSDIAEGERAGVSGTPTIFIDGVAFVGALSYEQYERAVLDALARPRSRGAGTDLASQEQR